MVLDSQASRTYRMGRWNHSIATRGSLLQPSLAESDVGFYRVSFQVDARARAGQAGESRPSDGFYSPTLGDLRLAGWCVERPKTDHEPR